MLATSIHLTLINYTKGCNRIFYIIIEDFLSVYLLVVFIEETMHPGEAETGSLLFYKIDNVINVFIPRTNNPVTG